LISASGQIALRETSVLSVSVFAVKQLPGTSPGFQVAQDFQNLHSVLCDKTDTQIELKFGAPLRSSQIVAQPHVIGISGDCDSTHTWICIERVPGTVIEASAITVSQSCSALGQDL
jgi:hypothetical protein